MKLRQAEKSQSRQAEKSKSRQAEKSRQHAEKSRQQAEKSKSRQAEKSRQEEKSRREYINRNTRHQNVHRLIRKFEKKSEKQFIIGPLTECSRHQTVENKVDNKKIATVTDTNVKTADQLVTAFYTGNKTIETLNNTHI